MKYHLAKSRKRGRKSGRWLALLLLAAVAGGWWYFHHPAKPHQKTKRAAVAEAGKPPQPLPPPPVKPISPPVLPKVAAVAGATNSAVKVVTNAPGRTETGGASHAPRDVLEAQIALARLGISSGSLDGVLGSQTRAALRAFQRKARLAETGRLDTNTRPALALTLPAFASYTVTSNDLARLQPLRSTWLGKSQQSALDYETVLELVAEKSRAHPKLIKQLNPGVDWTNVIAGATFTVPDASYPAPATKAGIIVISLAEKTLEVFDAETNLLAHFPCSIAKKAEKRPAGELHIVAVAPNPNYTFNPEVFPEVPEAQELGRKLILQPGPNNPVGTVWISLDKPGYGIHGTPKPEDVGRTESHGCFRLANWNAEFLLKLVWVGLPVWVEP